MKKNYAKRAIAKTSARKIKYPRVVYKGPKVETKVKDTTDLGFSIGTTAKIDFLANIDQGTTVSTRVGTKIEPMYLLGRLEFVHNPSAVVTFLRMFILQDLQQVVATTPGSISILQSTDTRSPLNIQNRGRFKIIRDELFTMNNFDKASVVYKINCKIPYPIQYQDNSGANIQKNGVYVFFLSSDNTNAPLGSYYFRLSYKDN